MSTKMRMKANIIAAGIAAAIMIAPASALATHHSYARHAASTAAPTTADWQIPLKPGHAFPRATGSAQYQSQPGQRELQLEVEHLRSLAGKRVVISVNGAVTGSTKVSARGIAQFDRNTELAQKVPTIVHGSTVTVRTSTGTLVASGRF
jgi:hypothetical protein